MPPQRAPKSYLVPPNGATVREEPTNASRAVRRLRHGDRIIGPLVAGQQIGDSNQWVRISDGYVWEPLVQPLRQRPGTPQNDPVDPPGPRRKRLA